MKITPYRQSKFGGQIGITLIELLVAIAGMLVLLYIIYNIYDASQAASINTTRRQASIDFAVRTIDEVGQIVTGAVHPSNLDGQEPATRFQRNKFTLPAHRGDKGIRLVTVGAAEDPAEGVFYQVIDAPIGAGEPGEPAPLTLGGKAENFTPEVSFRYALESTPNAPVAYSDSLPDGQWPALIEVSVIVKADEKDPQPIELRTAFIPGGVPMTAPPPAQPEPAAEAPSAEAAPAEAEPPAEAPAQPAAEVQNP